MEMRSEESIRLRAYQLWENGGRQDGRDIEYWLRAARELEDEDSAGVSGSVGAGRPALPEEGHSASVATAPGGGLAATFPAPRDPVRAGKLGARSRAIPAEAPLQNNAGIGGRPA